MKLYSLALISEAILSSSSKLLFKVSFWCLLKLEVMSGCSLIGCQEDSKYFHAHTADSCTHTQQMHPGLIGQTGFLRQQCKIRKPFPPPRMSTHTYHSDVWCMFLIRICQACGSAEHWRKEDAPETERWKSYACCCCCFLLKLIKMQSEVGRMSSGSCRNCETSVTAAEV